MNTPTFTLVTDKSFSILNYIPAPFNGKDNDFDAVADALFSDFCVINRDNTAVGFIEGDAVICKQGYAKTSNGLHLHLINEMGAGFVPQEHFPFNAAMRNFFGSNWLDIHDGWIKSGKPTFVVHDNYNRMYIHIAVHENAAISMIFTTDVKKEDKL